MTDNMFTELCWDGVNRSLFTTVPRVLTKEELDHDAH